MGWDDLTSRHRESSDEALVLLRSFRPNFPGPYEWPIRAIRRSQTTSMNTQSPLQLSSLDQGRLALARGAWEEALDALSKAVTVEPDNGAAWENLALARTWIQDIEGALEARQRAYAVFRAQADDLSAARTALDLVYDYLEIRGDAVVAAGWLQRARRLLQDQTPPTAEHALLTVWDACVCLDGDPLQAEAHARAAVSTAMASGAADAGILAMAVHGLALVNLGRVADGMRLLDEAAAAATAREITDPQWYYFACCCLIDACDRVRDFDRSLAWCHQLREFAERWRVPAFVTTCRIKYTTALLGRGDWQGCEAQLELALSELPANRPSAVPGAQVRLAELRRRQGRIREAETLLESAASHPQALWVRAALALDAQDAPTALDLLETALRRPGSAVPAERVTILELKTIAHVELHQPQPAQAAAADLVEIAELIGTPALRALANFSAGLAAFAVGDSTKARQLLEDAAFKFEGCGLPFEAGRAYKYLANCLAELGRPAAAIEAASAALTKFKSLGAAGEIERVGALLQDLQVKPAGGDGKSAAQRGPLTRRQREILGLITQGLNDQEIARRLFLSEHTVHRHVANVLLRLGVSSRSAAVAAALRGGML